MTHYVLYTWLPALSPGFLEYVFVNEVSAPMLMQRCSFLGFKNMLSLYIYGTLKKKSIWNGAEKRDVVFCEKKVRSGREACEGGEGHF